MWHSTLEVDAREQQAHASSYQRYDDHLDGGGDDLGDLGPEERDERPYQGWSAPEERGSHHDQQPEGSEHAGDRSGYQSGPAGRTNHGFDEGQEGN